MKKSVLKQLPQRCLFSLLVLAIILATPAFSSAWTFINPPKKSNRVSVAHTFRAFQLFDKRNYKKSLEHFEKAILEAEDCCVKERILNSIFYWNLAVYYEKNGLYQTAKPYFQYARRFLVVRN